MEIIKENHKYELFDLARMVFLLQMLKQLLTSRPTDEKNNNLKGFMVVRVFTEYLIRLGH